MFFRTIFFQMCVHWLLLGSLACWLACWLACRRLAAGLPQGYTDIRCDENTNNNENHETNIGSARGNPTDTTNANTADPNINKNTRHANILLSNVLPPQRNTFALIFRKLRSSGPGSERGAGDTLNCMSGHSFLRSRSA